MALRLEGIAAVEALGRLSSASQLFVNFFQPSFKLVEKQRVGIRPVKCVLDRSRTPGVGLGGGYLPKVASQPFGVSW